VGLAPPPTTLPTPPFSHAAPPPSRLQPVLGRVQQVLGLRGLGVRAQLRRLCHPIAALPSPPSRRRPPIAAIPSPPSHRRHPIAAITLESTRDPTPPPRVIQQVITLVARSCVAVSGHGWLGRRFMASFSRPFTRDAERPHTRLPQTGLSCLVLPCVLRSSSVTLPNCTKDDDGPTMLCYLKGVFPIPHADKCRISGQKAGEPNYIGFPLAAAVTYKISGCGRDGRTRGAGRPSCIPPPLMQP
jgi:hypothetical protein